MLRINACYFQKPCCLTITICFGNLSSYILLYYVDMEQDPMKRLEEQGVKFEVMSEEDMKELQPLIDAIQEDFAIEDAIAYFIKVAQNNAIFKELNR